MRRATGDDGYLTDAKQFIGDFQGSEEAKTSESLVLDWNNNYWSVAVLMASQTDLDAYHTLVPPTPPPRSQGAPRASPLIPLNIDQLGIALPLATLRLSSLVVLQVQTSTHSRNSLENKSLNH